ILAFFGLAGLSAPGLDEKIPRPFPFGVRPRGRLYGPDPAVFLQKEGEKTRPTVRRESAVRPRGRLAGLAPAAIAATSGGNAEPWRFVLREEAGEIDVYVDEHVDTSPMNAGHRMSRIAAGAALENLLRSARRGGRSAELLSPVEGAVARVRIAEAPK